MSNLKALLRILVLALLFGTGLWLMDQIAQNSMAGRSHALTSHAGPESAVPPPGKPPAVPPGEVSRPIQDAGAPGTNSAARPVPPAPIGDVTQPAAGDQPAGQSAQVAREAALTQGPAPSIPDSNALQEQSSSLRILRRADGQYIATEPVLFSTASSFIRPVSIQPLKRVAALLRERPDIKLTIVGYTDNLGLPENNDRVSAERAAAVMDFLVSEGIDASRLESRGMGSQNPIASNDTQLGRQANRRIELIIASPQ